MGFFASMILESPFLHFDKMIFQRGKKAKTYNINDSHYEFFLISLMKYLLGASETAEA